MEICNEFIFDIDRFISISTTQKALKQYSDGFEIANSLGDDIPIFLDTNVLLEFYKISFAERKEVKQFLSKNKERIFLTHQIESEFLKHRIDHINSYQKSLDDFLKTYSNIREEIEKLKNGHIASFNYYISTNKILLNDYENIRKELADIYSQLSEKLKNVFESNNLYSSIVEKENQIEEIKKKLEGEADIERNDDLLDIVAEFKVVPQLLESEIELIKGKYEVLKEKFDKVKSDSKEKTKYSFPGCGENKKTDKTGDLIIYHEILKFMGENKTNAIFLTSDLTKDDWLLRNKGELVPFTHYILNNFVCTNHLMYIFPAKDKIRISYDKVYTELENKKHSQDNETTVPIEQTISNENEDQSSDQGNDLPDFLNFEEITSDNFEYKIVGKIDLASFKRKISDEIFLLELFKSQDWATNYGGGFVGKEYFINKILGSSKSYDVKHAYTVLESLLKEGRIEEYKYKPDSDLYPEVDAIRIK